MIILGSYWQCPPGGSAANSWITPISCTELHCTFYFILFSNIWPEYIILFLSFINLPWYSLRDTETNTHTAPDEQNNSFTFIHFNRLWRNTRDCGQQNTHTHTNIILNFTNPQKKFVRKTQKHQHRIQIVWICKLGTHQSLHALPLSTCDTKGVHLHRGIQVWDVQWFTDYWSVTERHSSECV